MSCVAVVTAASTAFGDGGYFGGALGARAAGRSGAFAARADDPTAVLYNPAGIANLGGTVAMIGNRLSYNGDTFTRAPTQDWGNVQNGAAPTVMFDQVRNGTPWQAVEPLLAVASNLGLRDWGFALAAFAEPGASRLGFPVSGGQRYMMVAREAIIGDVAGTVAWRRRDVFAVGATLRWITVPRLDYSLIIEGSPFAQDAHPVSSSLDMLASTRGSDPFTFGATLGAWLRPAPFLEIGLSGDVVPATIETQSRLQVTPINPVAGSVTLTRDALPANDVHVRLPLPLGARLGVRYRNLRGAVERFDVEADVEYQGWSRVDQFTLDTRGLIASVQGADVDLGQINIAKHWRDTFSVKLGGDFAVVPGRLAVRGGLFAETAVAPAAYANVDFPGGPMLGGSLGGSVSSGHWEVALAYQLRHQTTVSVAEADARVYQQVPASACHAPYTDPNSCNPHYLGQPSPVINAGTYSATSHYLALALIYRFGS